MPSCGARGPIRTLTLNRPANRNALDGPLHAAMLSAVRTVADEPEVRAVVLTGSGDAFSAGGDFGLIAQMQEDAELRRATLKRGRTLFWSLLALEVPVIAAVNGAAVGAGATLALLCDIVLMAEQAYLAEPRVTVGLVPGDGGAIVWPLLAGVPAAPPISSPGIACRRRRLTAWVWSTEWWAATTYWQTP